MRNLLIAVAALLLCACATDTISSVPDLDAAKIYKPKLNAVKTRKLAVEINDARSPEYRDKSEELKAKLKSTLSDVFKESGFEVVDGAPNKFNLTVKEGDVPGQDKRDCVNAEAVLKNSRLKLNIDATSCYTIRSHGGGELGGDVTQAYETALNMLLQGMDKKLDEMKIQ